MGLIFAFIFLGAGALFMGAFLYFSAGLLFSWLAAAVRGANPEFTDKVFGPKERHIDITPTFTNGLKPTAPKNKRKR